jgi:alpha-L-fucosidase
MKKLILSIVLIFSICISYAQNTYIPTKENIEARAAFEKMRFGMFIHWGLFSQLGDGEWVMNNKKIAYQDYKKLADFFNPIAFDAANYVSLAKNAGMKYITLVTRHHDGFSLWDTKYSDYNVMHTPYGKDIVKQIADECHKQGIKLFFYYSLLDWGRDDYPWETGRTGPKIGRKPSNYASYLQFMKNQLTELLTNYGEIGGIWFDGHWDQTNIEGSKDRTSKIDWKYEEIYSLIHKLQPAALVGNNHHLAPFDGEDFQMFERDLPGENKSGYSFTEAANHLPLETCETLSGFWGWGINDVKFKSEKNVIDLLVGAAGKNANLLLNIGPFPNGEIEKQFVDTLQSAGNWLKKYGETIYETSGNVILAQKWGNITKKGNIYYIHILKDEGADYIVIPDFNKQIKKITLFDTGEKVKYARNKENPNNLLIYAKKNNNELDKIIKVQIK